MIQPASAKTPPRRLAAIYATVLLVGTAAGLAVVFTLSLLTGRSQLKDAIAAFVISAFLSSLLAFPLTRRFGVLQGNARLRPRATINIERLPDEVFCWVLDGAVSLSGAVKRSNQGRGAVTIAIPRSPQSFGETMHVSMTPVSPSGTRVDVRSRPRFPLTVVDYGKNQDNVRAFLNFLGTRTAE